jgi:DNA-binding transcriptional MerR regulator
MGSDDAAGGAADRLTLEEVAARSGVPSRTIRFYRQCGLVDPPARVGRQAWYTSAHVDRLRRVAALREQGLGIDAIVRVLRDPRGSRASLAPLLQIGEELRTPWLTGEDDGEEILDEETVLEIFGSDDPSLLPELESFDVIHHVAGSRPRRYRVPSRTSLELSGRLHRIGVHPQLMYRANSLMQTRLGDLAQELIELFAERPTAGLPGWPAPERVSASFAELQDVALQAVQMSFARAIHAALEDFVVHGGVIEAALTVTPDAPPDLAEPAGPSPDATS